MDLTGTSSSPSHQLPQEEVRSHKPVAPKEEAEIDVYTARWTSVEAYNGEHTCQRGQCVRLIARIMYVDSLQM